MPRRLTYRVAVLLLVLAAFGQANLVFAACSMERGDSAPMAALGEHDCAGCISAVPMAALAATAAPASTAAPMLTLRRVPQPVLALSRLDGAPPGGPPLRILLHSFLI